MGLDQELIRKTRELYKWDIYFSGRLELEPDKIFAIRMDSSRETNPLIERPNWVCNRRHPTIGIGSYPKDGCTSYGFIDLGSGRMQPYLPFAQVFPGRSDDYPQELLYAALLRLRRMISSKSASIRFPEFLADVISLEHLCLLESENPAVKKFYQPRIANILSDSKEDMRLILGHMKNAFNVPQIS